MNNFWKMGTPFTFAVLDFIELVSIILGHIFAECVWGQVYLVCISCCDESDQSWLQSFAGRGTNLKDLKFISMREPLLGNH